ncbi:MAG: hypothetical protein H6703_14490 [Myxococcales bacterium]|nr:hypothetical protein [Myxococcales bacterium]MCB9543639.1 hypothetical protein [Myxococcales bacterium]
MISGIWLFVLGALAAPGLILSKRPDAEQVLAKITPYQGWIGVISAFWGAWGVINSILNLGWLKSVPIFWITYLAVAVVQLGLGILLGVGVMKTFAKSPEAHARLDQTVAKLAPKQGALGIAAMALGVWMIIATLIF